MNKVVLDLGALDETAFAEKRAHGSWLHEEIAKVAVRVIGLDSSDAVPSNGLLTVENAMIRRGNILDLDSVLSQIDVSPDIVLLERSLSTWKTLWRSLGYSGVPRLKGKSLLLSTPNATAIHNCLIALGNRESTHSDHLCIFPFKTIRALLSPAGYESWHITPYHAEFVEMKQRDYDIRKTLVVSGKATIRLLERIFPLLSFGLITETTI
jgi:hypothetical protein